MSGIEGDRLVFLEGCDFPGSQDRPIPACWCGGFGRHEDDDLLARVYRLEAAGSMGRGYLDSVRQRVSLWETIPDPPEPVSVLMREGEDGSAALAVYVPDGEPLTAFLGSGGPLPEEEGLRLLRGVVVWLESLVAAPRLLANLEMEDFLVHPRDGWVNEVTLCPSGALLREEASLSDHRLATLWIERIISLHERIAAPRKGFAGRLGWAGRPFRPLLKQLESGPDRPLAMHFAELGAVLDQATEDTASAAAPPLPLATRRPPRGALATALAARARASDPQLYDGAGAAGGGVGPVFSNFTIPSTSLDGSRLCIGLLLPPESWFRDSLIDCVNRRLSHPFLKSHHHCHRIRSVYCDDHVTVLRTDPSPGVPLPTLLAASAGLAARELLAVSQKLHRALAQFESAGFDPGLESPWQVELHLEAGVPQAGWEALLAQGLSTWPSWELILRFEKPAESVLPGITGSSWDWVLQRLEHKFFPALVAWMLDWSRWRKIRGPIQAGLPLSPDPRLAALFEAAAAHLDPVRQGQRAKFLALLEEGLLGHSPPFGPDG